MAEPPTIDTNDAEQRPEREEGFVGSPLNRVFSCDPIVAREAINKALTPELRVEEISHTVMRDPVLVLELMRTANALLVRDGRPATTTVTGALVRLGSQLVHETISKVMERPAIDDPAVSQAFELHRERGRKAGIVCRIIADVRARRLSDDCHTVGVFYPIGEMLAAAHLQHQYVQLQCLKNFFSINYRLSQDHHFDVDRMRVLYLKRHGVPEDLVFAIDREGSSKSKERAVMKPICFAAMELIEAYETDRWGKYAPGKALSAKSTVRRLSLNDAQYEKLYERLTEYFSGGASPAPPPPPPLEAPPDETAVAPTAESIAEAIAEIVEAVPAPLADGDGPDEDGLLPFVPEGSLSDEDLDEEPLAAVTSSQTAIVVTENLLDDELDDEDRTKPVSLPQKPPQVYGSFCTLSTADLIAFKSPRSEKAPPHTEPPVCPPTRPKAKSDDAIIESFQTLIHSANTTEEALSQVLSALVKTYDKENLFSHSALIVVSQDRKSAHVVATHGVPSDNETELSLTDPLSPLARCFAKIQSFGTRASPSSPWNAKAFALSPIISNHATPVALYADCGPQGSISFQARRVFRKIIDILNQRLPHLPGDIPSGTTTAKE